MTFQSPGISPALLGKAHGNNPALSPTLHNRKSHLGKGPNHNVKPPAIYRHCGNNQKVKPNYSPAIPLGGEAMNTNNQCISGERDEHLILVNCLMKPDLREKKNQNSQSVLEQIQV